MMIDKGEVTEKEWRRRLLRALAGAIARASAGVRFTALRFAPLRSRDCAFRRNRGGLRPPPPQAVSKDRESKKGMRGKFLLNMEVKKSKYL